MNARSQGIGTAWGVLLSGGVVARSIAFLFSIVAARALQPAGYGAMALGVVVATVASTFIINVTIGLPPLLSRHSQKGNQDSYYSHALVAVVVVLGATLLVVIAAAGPIGVSRWMLVGVAANILGFAFLSTYKAVQAAAERTGKLVAAVVVANVLQLVAALTAVVVGWRSPALFLTIFGLSSVLGVLILEGAAPSPFRFSLRGLGRGPLLEIGRLATPILVQAVFYPIWFGADIVLLQALAPGPAVGQYAVAKNLTNVLYTAPAAMATVISPRLIGANRTELRGVLARTLGLTACITIPALTVLALAGAILVVLLFGKGYLPAAGPLPLLGIGMALHGFYLVLQSTWVGLGRTRIVPIAMGAAMVVTIVTGLALIPTHGAAGAAIAFAAGAAVQLAVIGLPTLLAVLPSAPLEPSAMDPVAGEPVAVEPVATP